ncbi:MAG TPA: hypothetical protein VFW00_02160 [Rhodocyclaceae bacterium]|nr:hypothetical protein [Rhodocyclaceae bacterium]
MRRAIPMLVFLMLTACSSLSPTGKLKPDVSNEQDVVALLGQPAHTWQNPNGSRTLDYTRQPNGTKSRFITLYANGKVEKIEDALDDERRNSVTPGMTPQDVIRILGEPGVKEHVPLTASEMWTWYFGNNNRHSGNAFQVRFTDGVVEKAEMLMRTSEDICKDASCMD